MREQREDARPNYYHRLEADAVLSLGMIALLNEIPKTRLLPGPTAGARADEKERNNLLFSRDAQFIARRTSNGFFCVNWKRLPTAEAAPALALCVPSSNGHRTDCLGSLETRFYHFMPVHTVSRWTARAWNDGFITAAVIYDGKPLPHEDDYNFGIEQHILFALLPDGRSFLRYEKAIARREVRIERIESLNLHLARDIFTDNRYVLTTTEGIRTIGPDAGDEVIPISGRWVNISGEFGLFHLRGPKGMALRTFADRQRGYGTLRVDRLEYLPRIGKKWFRQGETILESVFLLVGNLPGEDMPECAKRIRLRVHRSSCVGLEYMEITLPPRMRIGLAINFCGTPKNVISHLPPSFQRMRPMRLDPLCKEVVYPNVEMYAFSD